MAFDRRCLPARGPTAASRRAEEIAKRTAFLRVVTAAKSTNARSRLSVPNAAGSLGSLKWRNPYRGSC